MQFLVNNYENRYIFTHFRKKNRMFNTNSVIARIEGRYLDKMQSSTKAVGLYYGLVGPEGKALYAGIPGGLQAHALSSAISLDAYARIMTRPEPGYYYYPRRSNRVTNCPTGEPLLDENGNPLQPTVSATRVCDLPADFVVPTGSGEGRYIHNEYDYTQGYNWSDYQMQVGSYYEKVAATYYLMEGYNHFLQNSKEDYIDGRSRNINYATVYPEQMRKLWSYMMADDRTTLAPYLNVKVNEYGKETPAHIVFPSWSASNQTALTMPAGATIVDPLVGWEQQLPMMMYGFYFGGTTLTMDWVQMMRIQTPNGPEAVSYGDDNYLRFTDPNTGILYVARDYGDESTNGKVTNRGIGARMLNYAKEVAAATFQTSGVDEFGEPAWARNDNRQPLCIDGSNAGNGQPSNECNAAMTKVRYFSSNLDTLRELADWMGIGPINRR